MKKLFCILSTLILAIPLSAQAPYAFNYQGIARDLSGNPVLNKNIGLRVSILQGTVTGSSVYKELFLISTTNTGLFNIQIGKGTPVSGSIEAINWGSGPYFLKIEMDENGGSNYLLIGTSQLLSVPYALYAEKSGNEIKLLPPSVTTSAATNIGYNFATLNGIVNGNGFKTDVVFEYDTSAQLKNTIKAAQDPVIGASNVQVSANLSGLPPNKIYYFRVKGTNAVGISTGNTLNFVITTMNIPCGSVTDVEGNTYKTVQIGTQCWMAENLKTKKYSDGTAIPYVTDNDIWANLSTGAYCMFANNTTFGTTYGLLYNYYSVIDNHKLCPTGWHVPSYNEWLTLMNFVGGESIAGDMLRETGTEHWEGPNTLANNKSGFTALAGSWRGEVGAYYYWVGHSANWWSTTSVDTVYAYSFHISNNGSAAGLWYGPYFKKNAGQNVRCLKD